MNLRDRRFCVLASLAFLAGCREETVQRYQVPKPQQVAGVQRTGGLQYDTPPGWENAQRPVPMSIATLNVVAGDPSAQVTITPLAGDGGGLAQNLNRWRGQIKLGPLNEDELRKQTKETTVAASPATAVDFTGPESDGANRQRVLGVIWAHNGKTWFFKFKGPADLVAKHQSAFESFMKSVRVGGD